MQKQTNTLSFNLAIVLCIALATICSACTTGTWTEVTSLGGTAPTKITGHTLSAYAGNNKLYVFGGTDQNFTAGIDYYNYYSTLSSFSTSSQTWSTLSTSGGPSARAHHGAAISTAGGNAKLLVVGGYFTSFGSVNIKNDLWSWDIASGGWTQLTNAPTAVYWPGFVYYNGYAYLFGGVTNGLYALSNALHRYNVATNTWSTLSANGAVGAPSKRFNGNLVVIGGKLYMHGGARWLPSSTVGIPVPQNDTWVFDLSTNTWTDITPSSGNNMILSAAFPSYAASGSSFVLYGGDTGAGVNGVTGCSAPYPQQVSDDTWIGTVSGSSITYAKQTPAARPPPLKQAAGDVLGSCFYVFGGFDDPSCQVWYNKVYSYGL